MTCLKIAFHHPFCDARKTSIEDKPHLFVWSIVSYPSPWISGFPFVSLQYLVPSYVPGPKSSAAYLDLLLSIGRDGQLRTSIYDKRVDFNFHITNFPFLSCNIPASPAYGVFISQLIRFARACSSYECFIPRATRLSNKLLEQGYVKERLKSSSNKFCDRYGDFIKQ